MVVSLTKESRMEMKSAVDITKEHDKKDSAKLKNMKRGDRRVSEHKQPTTSNDPIVKVDHFLDQRKGEIQTVYKNKTMYFYKLFYIVFSYAFYCDTAKVCIAHFILNNCCRKLGMSRSFPTDISAAANKT